MDKEVIVKLQSKFDDMSHIDEQSGIEFWYARELMVELGYSRWENFETAIVRAKEACENSQSLVSNHFRDVTKMIKLGKGAQR
ncbi:MAG: DNA damage-inducible protein D, partial [Synergistaceae bacterium]